MEKEIHLRVAIDSILLTDLPSDGVVEAGTARTQGAHGMLQERFANTLRNFSVHVTWEEVGETADRDVAEATADSVLETHPDWWIAGGGLIRLLC